MQPRLSESRPWPSLCFAVLLLGCSASDSPTDTDAPADTEATSDGEEGGSSASTSETATSTSSADGSGGDGTPTSAEGPATTESATDSTTDSTTDPTSDVTTSGGSDACPVDAECSGPDDDSCEFGGACLACSCIGGDPPDRATYGECDACLPNEQRWEEGLGCVCAPPCNDDGICPAYPGGTLPGVQEPSCSIVDENVCVIPCVAGQNETCPPGRVCAQLDFGHGYCTFASAPRAPLQRGLGSWS